MVQVNEHKEEQILISIAGLDRPGLTADVMRVLAKYDWSVEHSLYTLTRRPYPR